MKPGHIHVFDGLRITTEHVNHLQTALHSGLQDLREILGLGKVQRGMAVTIEEDHVTVAPGLAFDQLRNRIVCDEPKTVAVSFSPDEQAQYVCVKYEQVEDGVVEGQATLVFDSCSVELRGARPEPGDNLVVVAKLVKGAEKIEVAPVDEAPQGPPPQEPAIPAAPALRVHQGVIRMNGTESRVSAITAATSLGEEEIALDFPAATLTAHALVLARVTLPPAATSSAESEAAAPEVEFRFECRADGEATVDDAGVAQLSISTVAATPASFDLSERELARLFLEMPAGSGLESMRSAYLAIRLERRDSGRLTAVCVLDWTAALDDEALSAIEDRKPALFWQVLFAWKALGASAV